MDLLMEDKYDKLETKAEYHNSYIKEMQTRYQELSSEQRNKIFF